VGRPVTCLIHFVASWAEAICGPHRAEVAVAAEELRLDVIESDVDQDRDRVRQYGPANVPAVAIEDDPGSLLVGALSANVMVARLGPRLLKRLGNLAPEGDRPSDGTHRFVVLEVFRPIERKGPILVGTAGSARIRLGTRLYLIGDPAHRWVEVLAVDMPTPTSIAKEQIAIVVHPDLGEALAAGARFDIAP